MRPTPWSDPTQTEPPPVAIGYGFQSGVVGRTISTSCLPVASSIRATEPLFGSAVQIEPNPAASRSGTPPPVLTGICFVTVFVAGSMRRSVFARWASIQTAPLSITAAVGPVAGCVFVAEFVDASITDHWYGPNCGTHTEPKPAATSNGSSSLTRATTVSGLRLTRSTSPLSSRLTQREPLSYVIQTTSAIEPPPPRSSRATTWFELGSILMTWYLGNMLTVQM